MKKAQITRYSEKGKIVFNNVVSEEIRDNEVLIKVKAAALNPVDNMIKRGDLKVLFKYSFPLTLGNEISGIVEKVGKNVRDFKVGDKVFSRLPIAELGGFSEKVIVDKKEIAIFPEYLSFEEAATIPLASLTALQAFEKLKIKKNKTIFISGATGSFGNVAVLLAKIKGLKIVVTGNIKNKGKMIELGVDKFIDYKKENFVNILSGEKVDYVIDTVGGEDLKKEFSILKNGGSLVSLKGVPNEEFAIDHKLSAVKRILCKLIGKKMEKLASKNNQKYYFLFVKSNGEQLKEIAGMLKKIELKPEIDSVFSFEEINDAFENLKNGGTKGKIVIKMD